MDKDKDLMKQIGELFLEDTCTVAISYICQWRILDIAHRVLDEINSIKDAKQKWRRYRLFCISLSKAVSICPDLEVFVIELLDVHPCFLGTVRNMEEESHFLVKLSCAMLTFVEHFGDKVRIPVDNIARFMLHHRSPEIIWNCTNAIKKKLQLSENDRNRILRYCLEADLPASDSQGDSKEDLQTKLNNMIARFTKISKRTILPHIGCQVGNLSVETIKGAVQHTHDNELHRNVVLVAGILLSKWNPEGHASTIVEYVDQSLPTTRDVDDSSSEEQSCNEEDQMNEDSQAEDSNIEGIQNWLSILPEELQSARKSKKHQKSKDSQHYSWEKQSDSDDEFMSTQISDFKYYSPQTEFMTSELANESASQKTRLVSVPSMLSNLRSLALAVAAGNPVLLQGPVGCGKTSLVEHLALLTGRTDTRSMMKIQLGDQTDSKALLGTYRCTDIPGEFVWQPGILTQAVTDGRWVLLEDIDYAPMDVVSILLPLLERGVLSVPGHGDNIQAQPHFRLFATQRLLGSSSGWHRQQSSSSVLLEKMWTKINVQTLSREELQQVISARYPQLNTVMDRILDIYFMLSAGKHDSGMDVLEEDSTVGKFLSHEGRLISTRDLMNWCDRIAVDFDIKSTATASLVLQEALDCFVACIPKQEKRVLVAQAIGAKLNITPIKAEYYCSKYKPDTEISPEKFTVGRVNLKKCIKDLPSQVQHGRRSMFSFTRQSAALLEQVAMAVKENEPVLLVGETGTGKTSSVQYLAEQLGYRLRVINMNQQSDSSDLLGGFKPVDMKHVVKPLKEDFEILFCETFSRSENAQFLNHIQENFTKKKWSTLFTLIEHTLKPAIKRGEKEKIAKEKYEKWVDIKHRLQQLKIQVQQSQNVLAFSFIEGTLVKALQNGDWVLLDEINLAAAETLECLSGLLESHAGSIVLTERGDVKPVQRHADFRVFACMNPATDVGKKDLPMGIRNRFTEFYVDELDEEQDLKILVNDYLRTLSLTAKHIEGIVKFYLTVRKAAASKLTDGTGHKPHFSLRTLCRALRFAAHNPCGQVGRSLYEGFCLSFLTQLDRSSHPIVEQLISDHIIGKSNIKAMLKQGIQEPPGGQHLQFEGYWISKGKKQPSVPEKYILTKSVRANLRDLARVVSAGQHPVLLQGETSVGKTSLVTWLAESTGNMCVRVNNHEHTDLQEYVGCYSADETGKLVFKEGVLVEAMRQGHWIILDELNLAPTDVLEALNRLLDDNRELFIPETQETIRAHPKFMLFATQNPPGHYGGRKMLSRAFRNRFIELHFDEIPSSELEIILHKRCDLPMSYAKRLVAAMIDLQTRRRGSGVFAGKQGFMTLRDLFRWAQRYKCKEVKIDKKFYDWDQHMADHGYMIMAGRVRKSEEAVVVQEVIQKHLKRSVDPNHLFTLDSHPSPTTVSLLEKVIHQSLGGFQHIVWTYGMRRMAVLIGHAVQFNEPVLLVGETGCGKTSICQLLARLNSSDLHSINCHLHTESADFLGGLRPCRSHEQEEDDDSTCKLFEWIDGPLVNAMRQGAMFLIDEVSLADDSVLERLNSVLEPERTLLLAEKGGGDGSQNEVEHIKAREGFQVFATMNPGGDFGKKELSPALRNRFTEIWCPQLSNRQDLIQIIEHNLSPGIHLCNQEDGTSGVGRAIMDFVEWFSNNEIGKRCTVSIRDILSWVNFINTCSTKLGTDYMETETSFNQLDPAVALIHGACLVFLDGLGAGTTSRGRDLEIEAARTASLMYLLKLVSDMTHQSWDIQSLGLLDKQSHDRDTAVNRTDDACGTDCEEIGDHMTRSRNIGFTADKFYIWPFSITKGKLNNSLDTKYAIEAPTTCVNAQRILRALQLPRPLLLEGSPGVGKTSLVAAIAKAAQRELVRINLSEQTDVTDLFGADLPVEGAEGGKFAWRDGPLLRALKLGHWIVLDELNLASQSVLEGLNACLDHRAEVYVPELGKTFHIQHENTRLFACQNPLNQGGGRKGLPRSFLNRFTQVYVEPLSYTDLVFISQMMFPQIPYTVLSSMVSFNMQIHQETMVEGLWGQKGGPWEFNLRDLFRWCDLLLANQMVNCLDPGEYVGLLYSQRMRTNEDKQKVLNLYSQVFEDCRPAYRSTRRMVITNKWLQIGHSRVNCIQGEVTLGTSDRKFMLYHCIEPLEAIMKCLEMNWMCIIVGSQSSGKSSVVQVLSQLTGHKLHVLAMNSAMDTTELLGGFEQADVARHIDDLASEAQEYLRRFTACHLLKRKTYKKREYVKTGVENVQQLWSDYKDISEKGENLTSVEEVQLLKDRLVKLTEICRKCQHDPTLSEDLEMNGRVNEKILKLEESLKHVTPGSGGGAFEWIDSLLVQALQSGDWLLIDNVNFCNASVLDRLNALLEPNGVLSINERGVIDGEIPTIKPHPEFSVYLTIQKVSVKLSLVNEALYNRFQMNALRPDQKIRLFLIMDPKFGEISRAMRNRGVEIYIPGEEENSPYCDQDLQLMLHGVGLKCNKACDWLINLYKELRSSLPRGERPGILLLLHVGMVAKQQIDRGMVTMEALKSACRDVLVKNVKSVSNRKMITEVLGDHYLRLEEKEEILQDYHLPHVPAMSLVSTEDFNRDTLSANFMRQTSQITHIVQDVISSIKTYKRGGQNTHSLIETGYQKLLHAGILYQDFIPVSEWTLANLMMQNLVLKLKHMVSHVGFSTQTESHLMGKLGEFSNFMSLSINKMKELYRCQGQRTISRVTGDLLPGDGRWEKQCLTCAYREISTDCQTEIEVFLKKFFFKSKVYQFLFSLENGGQKIRQKVEGFLRSCRSLQLRKLRGDGASDSDLDNSELDDNTLGQEVVMKYQLLQAFNRHFIKTDKTVSRIMNVLCQDHSADLQKMLTNLKWLPRLYNAMMEYVSDGDINKVMLFWTWFEDNIVSAMHDTGIYEWKEEIKGILSQVESLDKAKKYYRYWSSWPHPKPFPSCNAAELALALEDLSNVLDIHSKEADLILRSRTTCQLNERINIVPVLMKAYISLLSTDQAEGDLETIVTKSQQLLHKYGLVTLRENNSHVQNMEVNDSYSTQDQKASKSEVFIFSSTGQSNNMHHVELWPLYDHIFLLNKWCLVNHLISVLPSEFAGETTLTDFGIQFTASSPKSLSNLQIMSMEECKQKRLNILSLILKDLYHEMWMNTAGQGIDRWLNWSTGQESSELNTEWGPSSLHRSLVSYCGFSLSSVEAAHVSSSGGLLTRASIGNFKKHIQKLELFSTHIWYHASLLSTRKLRSRTLEVEHVTWVFMSMLESLADLIDTEGYADKVTEYRALIKHVSAENTCEAIVNSVQQHLMWYFGAEQENVIRACLEGILEVNTDETDLRSIGKTWAYVGHLNMMLAAPCSHVDPVQQIAIKLQIYKEELADIERELEVRCSYHKVLTGLDLLQVPSHLIHPHIPYLVQRREELCKYIEELQGQLAYRPPESQFRHIVTDIKNFCADLNSEHSQTQRLIRELHSASKSGNITNQIHREKAWQKTQSAFIAGLEQKYPLYRDIITPFIVAVHQVKHGVHLLASCAQQVSQLKKYQTSLKVESSAIQETLSVLTKFPFISETHRNSLDLSTCLWSSILQKIIKECSYMDYIQQEQVISRLHHSVLKLLQNETLWRRELNQEIIMALSQIFHTFMLSWQHQEEMQRQKEAEDSLYKYKTKVHGDDRENDVIEEAEFRETFPSFEKDFQDLIGPQSLEESFDPDTESEVVTDSLGHISDKEMVSLCQVHQLLFSHITTTDWLSQGDIPDVRVNDVIEPSVNAYMIAASLRKWHFDISTNEYDIETFGGHLLVSFTVQEQISPACPQSQTNKVYDIYHDPNIFEVIKCPPVLHRLMKRVCDLQREWPDHPTLKQISQIVERILSFPVSSPVVKFLTGLELVLEKSQEWETNAAKHVSVAAQLGEISALIMEWRKLELSCWRECLDVVCYKESRKACKWWFHLYQLLESSLVQKCDEASEEEEKIGILKTLKEFMERSTLGEYEARLAMLKAFHCQAVHMDHTGIQDYMLRLLWNLHQYFYQFLPIVQDKIVQLRKPIEKELKGFVKIARWTDMNYWALKQTTEKTHRTLHKHMKTFKGILEQPVQGILCEIDKGDNSGHSSSLQWRDQYKLATSSLMTSISVVGVEPELVDTGSQTCQMQLYSKLGRLCKKMSKHWTSITKKLGYESLVITLDEFSGELIDSIKELQGMEVTQMADKEKQKSEAKHIGQRKRKALSDLFKYLSKLGLSYRKGLLSQTEADSSLLVPPLNLAVISKRFEASDFIQDVWSSCHNYFYKCIARKARFSSALQTPSKELGVGDIDRCRGFTEHLDKLVKHQCEQLADVCSSYCKLRDFMDVLSKLRKTENIQPPQRELHTYSQSLASLLITLREGLAQVDVLFLCCPKQQGDLTQYPSPFPRHCLSEAAVMKYGDERWTECQSVTKMMVQSSTDLYIQVLPLTKQKFLTHENILQISEIYKKLMEFLPILKTIENLFADPNEKCLPSFIQTVKFLQCDIQTKSQEYEAWLKSYSRQHADDMDTDGGIESRGGLEMVHIGNGHDVDGCVEKFSEDVEKFIAGILLSVQTLTKKHKEESITGTNDDADDEDDLKEGHLVALLYDRLRVDNQLLQPQKHVKSLQTLVEQVIQMTDKMDGVQGQRCGQILGGCLDLVQQYSRILEHHILNLLAENKATSKLLSILLGVFTELTTKGFCTPAEFEDEMAGEGATDFEDIEGGGMGQGEGVKDVSDQIENEDQLDEARKAGEEQKEEDFSKQPDIRSEENAIEMSEDMEGKVHDLESADKEERSNNEDEGEEEEIDKQMGDVDGDDTEKLDEQMWGSDGEDEEESEEKKEEFGPGSSQEQQSQLVAKDDNQDKTETEDQSEKQMTEENTQDNDDNQKPHELDQIDESEYDDEKVDPHHGQQEPELPPDNMDLPDDLNLDEDEAGKDEQHEGQEDNENVGGTDVDMKDNTDEEEKTEEVDDPEKEEDTLPEVNQDESGLEHGEEKKKDEESEREEGEGEQGFTAPEDQVADEEEIDHENPEKTDDKSQPAEAYGKSSHDSQNVEQSDTAQDQGGEADNEQDESEGTGKSTSDLQEGHEGQSAKITHGSSSQQPNKPVKRKVGHSNEDRSLGSTDQNYKKLKTTEESTTNEEEEERDENKMEAELYEHVKEAKSSFDAQTLDVATSEQQTEQAVPNKEMEEAEEVQESDVEMREEDPEEIEDVKEKVSSKLKTSKKTSTDEPSQVDDGGDNQEEKKYEIEGEVVPTAGMARGPDSTIHTVIEHLYTENKGAEIDIDQLRQELEEQLSTFTNIDNQSPEAEAAAAEAWHGYEALTSSLSQELCEQLRLVLEPSQATKLRGDYRTGKRLNMRKVIPYIASQFRKDKIWLRRTKPSKRQYQIMLAIDDSSSMVDNHSKQLAYESLALIANALTLLEAGQLSICSFGEAVRILHPFTEQFSSQSGARILQQFTFEQKKTKVAQLLKHATATMVEARSKQHGVMGNPDTSQLLLIVSDGRGLFIEGMETVKTAVRQAREANIFLVFVIIDNPQNKDSILDIKVPVFKSASQMPEIKSYMDHFPFPFYIILRDINSLPQVLCDALRQWFELVTAVDH